MKKPESAWSSLSRSKNTKLQQRHLSSFFESLHLYFAAFSRSGNRTLHIASSCPSACCKQPGPCRMKANPASSNFFKKSWLAQTLAMAACTLRRLRAVPFGSTIPREDGKVDIVTLERPALDVRVELQRILAAVSDDSDSPSLDLRKHAGRTRRSGIHVAAEQRRHSLGIAIKLDTRELDARRLLETEHHHMGVAERPVAADLIFSGLAFAASIKSCPSCMGYRT